MNAKGPEPAFRAFFHFGSIDIPARKGASDGCNGARGLTADNLEIGTW